MESSKPSVKNTNSNITQFLNCNIGVHRIVEVHYLQGDSFFEIITYSKSPSGNYSKVSNKCMKLPLTLYRVLIDHLDHILDHFKIIKEGGQTEYSLHLGELVFLRIDKDIRCIDIRKHYLPVGAEAKQSNLKPGFPGVGMRVGEFDNFLTTVKEQLSELTQIDTVVSCNQREDHSDFAVLENCKICNPFKLFYFM